MFNAKALTEKWNPVLGHEGAGAIKDNYRKAVTAVLLENTEKALREERGMINEASNTVGAINAAGLSGAALGTQTGGLAGFDPVMISLIRRAMPNLVAYDICGVQPMSGPTGLIFAMKSHYQEQGSSLRGGPEALYNEPDSNFSAVSPATATNGIPDYNQTNAAGGNDTHPRGTVNPSNADANPGLLNDGGTYERGERGIVRATAETLGAAGTLFNYTLELAQDLKAIHGLDAEQELANLLSSEILAEINREVVRTVYTIAKPGAQNNVANAGIFDLDVDSNGRWSVEKFKGLMFQVERDANAIAQQTRRGKGNFIITSADVASALAMSGTLDYSSGLGGAGGPSIGEVDDTGNLLVGTMNGRIKVYVDPYSANVSSNQFYVAGYKGTSPYDAGLFYCPYVPLQMLRSIDPSTFQPKIGFKTRYGMVSNPFVEASAGVPDGETLTANVNQYYRRVLVKNLM